MKAFITDLQGQQHEISLDPHLTLMENIKDSGVPILAMCGGGCACSTCHVHIAAEWANRLPPRTPEETDTLGLVQDFRDSSRLACQVRVTPDMDGLTLSLTEDTRE